MINDYEMKFGPNVTLMSEDPWAAESHSVMVNGLKRREQQIIGFPVKLNGGVRSSLSAECVQSGCSDISVPMNKPEFSNFIQNALEQGTYEDVVLKELSDSELQAVGLVQMEKQLVQPEQKEALHVIESPSLREVPDRELAAHLAVSKSSLLMNLAAVNTAHHWVY